MKALQSTPISAMLTRAVSFHREPRFTPVPVTSGTTLRPVELRRYLRDLRENRRYTYTRDFIF